MITPGNLAGIPLNHSVHLCISEQDPKEMNYPIFFVHYSTERMVFQFLFLPSAACQDLPLESPTGIRPGQTFLASDARKLSQDALSGQFPTSSAA
jgi:hypothetical protein